MFCVWILSGVDLTANQDELSDKETFQMEFDKTGKKWRFRTCENKYWSLESANGIRNVGNERCVQWCMNIYMVFLIRFRGLDITATF